MNPTRNVALVPTDEPNALTEPPRVVSMFERLVADPNVDVEKLERLMAMQERALAYTAKTEYYAAFAQMQGELPTVEEKGTSHNGKFATHEDIVEAVRPVLQRHGFMLSFRTEFPTPASIKVTAVLAHKGGHAEHTEFISGADTSGSKNAIQALGSAQSYAQRYTTRALLNIASREHDDNGATAGTPSGSTPGAPTGFDDWLDDLRACADEGWPKLSGAWNKSKPEYRDWLNKTANGRAAWEALKTKAQKVQR